MIPYLSILSLLMEKEIASTEWIRANLCVPWVMQLVFNVQFGNPLVLVLNLVKMKYVKELVQSSSKHTAKVVER